MRSIAPAAFVAALLCVPAISAQTVDRSAGATASEDVPADVPAVVTNADPSTSPITYTDAAATDADADAADEVATAADTDAAAASPDAATPAPTPALTPASIGVPESAPVDGAPAPSPPATAPAPERDQLQPGQFEWTAAAASNGPGYLGQLIIVISLGEQRAFVFRNGERIALSTISSGKPGMETPAGVYPILEKARMHRSNLYDAAPMPFMQRLTWDGVALHAGKVPGYAASHGCVRLPKAFAQLLFGITDRGQLVVVSQDGSIDALLAAGLPDYLAARIGRADTLLPPPDAAAPDGVSLEYESAFAAPQ